MFSGQYNLRKKPFFTGFRKTLAEKGLFERPAFVNPSTHLIFVLKSLEVVLS